MWLSCKQHTLCTWFSVPPRAVSQMSWPWDDQCQFMVVLRRSEEQARGDCIARCAQRVCVCVAFDLQPNTLGC